MVDLTIVLGTLFICALVYALQYLLSWRSSIIPNIPIASGYNPITGNLFAVSHAVNNGFLHYMIDNMEANNFKQFQILAPGLHILSTCNPDHLEFMFSKEHFADFVKGEEFQINFAETLGHGIFAVDGKEWAEKRKVSSYLFSSNSLRHHMSGVFLEHTNHVLDTLLTLAEEKKAVDVQDLFARYTFDSICTIAFGMEVNSLGGNERDVQFQRSYDIAQMTNSRRFLDPFWKLQRFFGVGLEGGLKRHVEVLDKYIYEIIDQRLEEMRNDKDRGDMLSLYIQHGQKKSKDFGRKYLRDMVMNFIIAGRDTTAAASMWVMYELSKNPEAEAKLLAEIAECVGDEVPTYDVVTKMPYLRSVVYETLRLHPSVPLDGKFAAVDTYLEPGHIFLRKGSTVDYNIYMINRDPSRYENPNDFVPERWMKEGKFVEREEKEYPTFNLKPRGCLGKRMAEFEASMLIVVVLPKIKFALEDKNFTPKFQTNAILFVEGGMSFNVEKRV